MMRAFFLGVIDYIGIAALVTAIGSVIIGVVNAVMNGKLGTRTTVNEERQRGHEETVRNERDERRQLTQTVTDIAKQMPPPGIPVVPQFPWPSKPQQEEKP